MCCQAVFLIACRRMMVLGLCGNRSADRRGFSVPALASDTEGIAAIR
jgi:hypothetical protein